MGDSATVIDRVSVFGYDLTYAHGDYVMSAGRVVNVLPSTVVRITTRGGVEGFGETCPLGRTYLPGFGEGARAALRELAPALIGVDAANLAAVNAGDGRDAARPRVRQERDRRGVLGHPRSGRGPAGRGAARRRRCRPTCRSTSRSRSVRPTRWRRSSSANVPAGSTTSSSSSATRPSGTAIAWRPSTR